MDEDRINTAADLIAAKVWDRLANANAVPPRGGVDSRQDQQIGLVDYQAQAAQWLAYQAQLAAYQAQQQSQQSNPLSAFALLTSLGNRSQQNTTLPFPLPVPATSVAEEGWTEQIIASPALVASSATAGTENSETVFATISGSLAAPAGKTRLEVQIRAVWPVVVSQPGADTVVECLPRVTRDATGLWNITVAWRAHANAEADATTALTAGDENALLRWRWV